MTDTPAKGPWFTVPPATPAQKCRACPKMIYFVRTARGSTMPVDCGVPGGVAPTATESGEGVSHFATCPNADRFRRGK